MTVTGNTLVSGGGVDSVVIIDTDLGTVEIEVPDGSPVRLPPVAVHRLAVYW